MSSDPDGEGFLSRWSRRKLEVDHAQPMPQSGETDTSQDPEASAPVDVESSDQTAADTTDSEVEEGDDRFDDVDFEALDYQSDYTRFMGADVPEDVRNQALQKLWVSDPILANVDGLTDYSEDFTDAALAVPLGMLKTAHKVGRGFLSDEDVAKWEGLSKEPAIEPNAPSDAVAHAKLPISVGLESPVQDEVRALFAQSDTYTHNLYPAESNHMTSPEMLVAAGAIFAVARATRAEGSDDDHIADGAAIGCGALVLPGDGTGELKRMWVVPEARGKRVGRNILERLLEEARARQLDTVRLETGIRQPEALGLYENAGFERRTPFAGYADDPNSIFMELKLAQPVVGEDELVEDDR